jgi:hypothetical protein
MSNHSLKRECENDNCSVIFVPTDDSRQKYCSTNCKLRQMRKRKRIREDLRESPVTHIYQGNYASYYVQLARQERLSIQGMCGREFIPGRYKVDKPMCPECAVLFANKMLEVY